MFRSVAWAVVLLSVVNEPLHAQFDGPDVMLCPNCTFPLTADMDDDGDIDLVFTSPFTVPITWMKNHGDGTFDPPILLANNDHHLSIDLIGDADDDGDIDMVGMTRSEFYPDSVVALLRNEGGTFVTEVIDQPMSGTHPPDHFADIDGDGDLDLLSITGDLDVWYRNMGNGTYARKIISRWCQPVRGPYTSLDVEGDGDMDLVSYSTAYGRLIVHWNIGTGRLGPFTFASPFLGNFANGLATDVAELNNDGLMDLVVGGRPFLSIGDGTFERISGGILYPDEYQNLGNVDCSPVMEAVMTSLDFPLIQVFALNSEGVIVQMLNSPISPMRSDLADLNGDGRNDLLLGPTFMTGPISWRYNDAIPPVVSFEIPSGLDTLTTDTTFLLMGGSPSEGGGYYEGPGVFNDSLYSEHLAYGWNTITYHHASFLSVTRCEGSAVDSIYFAPSTFVPEQESPPPKLFPNPADDHLSIRTNTVHSIWITVHDVLGHMLVPPIQVRGGASSEVQFSTADLANGTYRLTTLRDNVRVGSSTFIVRH